MRFVLILLAACTALSLVGAAAGMERASGRPGCPAAQASLCFPPYEEHRAYANGCLAHPQGVFVASGSCNSGGK